MKSEEVLCAVIPAFASIAIVLSLLTRYPIMYGIDGPYYLIQLKHLISEGALKYPDPPLTYYMLLPFYASMPDPNLGIKIGVAFYAALTSIVLYMTFTRVSGSVAAGLTASFLYIVSPFTLRLSMDFIKNFIGILFIALFLYSALCVRDRKFAVTLSAFSTIAAALSHVLDFGVLALMAALLLLSWAVRRDRASKVVAYASASALIISAIILVSALVIAPELLGYDASKLVEFLKNPTTEEGRPISPQHDFFIPAILLAAGGLAYPFLAKPSNRKLVYVAFTASILLVALNLPLIAPSWLFRFRLMSSILIPILPAIVVAEAKTRNARAIAFLTILGFTAALTLPTIPAMRPSIPPQGYQELLKISEYVPMGSTLLIPDTALRYWVEAVHEENYNIVSKPSKPLRTGTYLVMRVLPNRPIRLPPRAKPVFNGAFIRVFQLK